MTVQFAPAAMSADRPFSAIDQMHRCRSTTWIDQTKTANLCASKIHVGIFFDGTNNNKQRDQLDVLERTRDANQCSHSNVVVLYDAYRDEPDEGYFSFYVPGVGTPFLEIGEKTETQDGKSTAWGGDARINWAMLRLLDAMHFAIHRQNFFSNKEVGKFATTAPLHAGMDIGPNLDGKRQFFTGDAVKRDGPPTGRLANLKQALESFKPKKLFEVNVSVFGFSRGAAQARAFCHFVHHVLLQQTASGSYTLAGVPFRLNFLGLFDSVASVGMADSSPFWRGLGGWANGTLDIVPSVERTVHLCAAHEIRANFPLSTARAGPSYPANCVEKVYPGAHSDVGGGYPAGSQGKSAGARSRLLSQMPLVDMYREAQRCMVPLLTIEQLLTTDVGKRTAADFDIDPACIARFNAYRTWTAGVSAATVDALLQGHMRQYWLWRLRHIGRTDALESHKHASSQDRQDVLESDGDFMQDMADALRERRMYGDADTSGAAVSDAKRDFVKLNAPYAHGAKPDVPPLVHEFFDVMVHDSHASFYMVGPVTAYDQQQKVLQLQARLRSSQEQLQKLLADPRNASRMAGATPDAMLSINELGQRILDHQRHHPGELPLLTDADRAQLLAMEDQRTSATVRLVTRKTRRELGGHIRYRRVFDGS
jgi:hypothetical protein